MNQQTFAGLGVSAPVVEALAELGIFEPFAIQELVVADALAGRDVLAKAPTGSGKTLAFTLPILELLERGAARPSALVLVPTRELASQVADVLGQLAPVKGFSVAAVYGGVSIGRQAKEAKAAHVLVATPGRLEDLANRRLVDLGGIRILVLDEADRMLDMGFQPQVDRIVKRLPRQRQTMFFSATLDGEVGRLSRAYTTDPGHYAAGTEVEHVDDVDHQFLSVTADSKVDALVELLKKDRGLALVFTRTKRGADRLVLKLRRAGVDAAAMHGDMGQAAREKALARFESGKVTTLVATDVAARGLDLEASRHVSNFDPPEDNKGYVHRVGRTGRAGRTGTGVTLVLPEQQADMSRIAAGLELEEEFASTGMTVAPARLVYTSRRGRNSRFGPSRPRRKI